MRRAFRLEYLSAAVLVAVALTQLVLAPTVGLSAWLGGGFGMFATTDARGLRHLHVIELRPGIEREIFPPTPIDDVVRRAQSLPTDHNLASLARWMVGQSGSPPPVSVRVEVWQTRFDPETLEPVTVLMRALETPVPVAGVR